MATTVTVNLSDEEAAALARVVSDGRFRDLSEALAEAVRTLLRKQSRAEHADALRRSYEEHPEEEALGDVGLRLLAERLEGEPRI